MQKIKRTKVNQAIEVLWLNRKNGQRKKPKMERVEKSQNIYAQCKIMQCYKRSERQYPKSFSKHRILSELKSHVGQRNWSKVKNLVLLLLHFSTDLEPLIWRYIFILTLYGNADNISNISKFFKICIGSQHSDRSIILKNALLLQHPK